MNRNVSQKQFQDEFQPNSPTPQSCFDHRILLNYRFWHIERRSLLQTARRVAPQHRRYWVFRQRIVIVMNSRQLNIGIIIGWNYRRLGDRCELVLAVGIGVGIVWCELTRYVLNVEFLWWLLEWWRLLFDAFYNANWRVKIQNWRVKGQRENVNSRLLPVPSEFDLDSDVSSGKSRVCKI